MGCKMRARASATRKTRAPAARASRHYCGPKTTSANKRQTHALPCAPAPIFHTSCRRVAGHP
eukprot:8144102-Lingulodinium_polyedra.AAC.1